MVFGYNIVFGLDDEAYTKKLESYTSAPLRQWKVQRCRIEVSNSCVIGASIASASWTFGASLAASGIGALILKIVAETASHAALELAEKVTANKKAASKEKAI